MIYLEKKKIPILEARQIGKGYLIESDAGSIPPEMNGLITEGFKYEADPNKPIILKCVLQKEGVLNKNQRIYPREVLDREVSKYKKYMDNMNAVGEGDHPDTSNIAIDNIAHRILKTYWQGNTLYGEIEIIVSPGYLKYGVCSMIGDKILRYLELGITIGISSRGLGSVNEVNGRNIVQDDFELICFDLVVTPSTPNAYLFHEQEKKIDESKSRTSKIITSSSFNSSKLISNLSLIK